MAYTLFLAFRSHADYKPGDYIRQFPDLLAVSAKSPGELTSNDVDTLLWKARHVGDRALVGRFLPEVLSRYLSDSPGVPVSRLYAAILTWWDSWTSEQRDVLSSVFMAHWRVVEARYSPPRLTVTTTELSFLLIWLADPTPLEHILRDLAVRYHRQEVELQWDDTWGSAIWTPFIQKIRVRPIPTLLEYATTGEVHWQEFCQDPVRDQRILAVLGRTGML